ncbi:Dak phosphatase [Marinitoga sp. 1135]|uniref:DAK2 domain fusion protein YloV n=1 Tax=Marinitoga piezophila (strain DSM 14283 / JCM 11233 / KA3) TaxID=443254 RepID=H2J3G6_MARPK|nr:MULTISPECIES: DAK2 domain-containing protein [Marinitoga]AEX85782.1 DAK2 domain fusion protein YloV [Marinitoga piezophila KA3]APT76224.1 Dak phosphatase [Marinitoga sp. 1137]NUU95983.1 Dak phosphatase [Marinitoga sp. 1135]NUU97895.1 Dak phosphatase [Marinitoga sp. 1138]
MKELHAKDFYIAFKKAAETLIVKKDEINALNVFPVPDGDTGSNMSSGMLEACEWLDKTKNKNKMKDIMKNMRDGLLMGARGNSGVILSQIFRGFTETLEDKEVVTTKDFIEALKKAKEVAYHAVIKPVEGTMLTLIRKLAERAEEELSDIEDFEEFINRLYEISEEIVEETPKYLKKLREANVVDAGAKGLSYIIKGFRDAINGDTEVDLKNIESASAEEIKEIAYEEIKFQYCTECVLKLNDPDISKEELDKIRAFLEELGDSIVLVHQGDFLKTHVHTNHPGKVFEEFLLYGELYKVKVDNMKVQHEHVTETYTAENTTDNTEEQNEVFETNNENWGIITVSPGDGLTQIFKSLGVDMVIFGGQTMNPSVKDFMEAIEKLPQKKILILPNNPNIILTAEKVADMVEDKEVLVVKTKYIQEGVAAMLAFDDTMEKDELKEAIESEISAVVPIQVTYAVRDSEIAGESIKKDEYLVFVGKELKAHGFDLNEAVLKVLREKLAEGFEIMTIFYGQDIEQKTAELIANELMEEFSDLEVEIHNGGQPHYPLLISLE